MRVPIEVIPEGAILCHSEICPFRKTCANHETAGDYRAENGFTPYISDLDINYHDEIQYPNCQSISSKDNGNGTPANIRGLGCLYVKDGKVQAFTGYNV